MKSILCFFTVLGCFYVTSALRPRINNGKVTDISDFKYVVGIKLDTLLSEYYCVGGIIHEKYILTAAHCLSKKKDKNPKGGRHYEYKKFKVQVYANTDSMKKISSSVIKRKATDVYFTKQFFNNGADDIAILKLDRSLPLGTQLHKLQLPPLNSKHQYDSYYNSYAVVAGYGDDLKGDKKTKKHLKKMDLKVISYVDCYRIYDTDTIVNSAKHLCSKAVELVHQSGKVTDKKPIHDLGTCEGDSGSPIVYNGNIVIGVVSKGSDCDGRVHPELHTRVSNYMSFIDTVIHERHIDPTKIVHHPIK